MSHIVVILLSFSAIAWAEGTAITVKDVPTQEDTSIEIKKGSNSKSCVEYQIIEGKDEVFGEGEKERAKAYASWKAACAEWKQSMRELNKENQILQLNCNSPESTKADFLISFKSAGTYKIKTKMKDKP